MNKSVGAVLSVWLLAGLGGCTSSADALRLTDPEVSGLQNTGTYPTFSKPLTAAAEQMSDAEAELMGAELQALAYAREAGTISEEEYQRRVNGLRNLARNHDENAVREIEN